MNKKTIQQQRKYHLLIFIVIFSLSSLIGGFLYLFGEPLVVWLLGKSFGESVNVFKAISITIIPLVPIVMLLGNILIYSGYEKYYLIGLIVDGIVIVSATPVFISRFNVVGAVYSLALAMLLTVMVLSYYYFKINRKLTLDRADAG